MAIVRNIFWKLLFSTLQRRWWSFMALFCQLLKLPTYVWRNWLWYFFIQAHQIFKFYLIFFMLESVHELYEVHDLSFLFFIRIYLNVLETITSRFLDIFFRISDYLNKNCAEGITCKGTWKLHASLIFWQDKMNFFWIFRNSLYLIRIYSCFRLLYGSSASHYM